ncbi:MAG TPA: glycosyl hydrolase [Opitutaceae bacterium]|nr:glycosyl hydrolase [Opitutaceae bacterium]
MNLSRRDFIRISSITGIAFAVSPRLLARAKGEQGVSAGVDALAEGFLRVPAAAKPGCYWWWFGGHIDAAGLTRDLEEFAAKGIGEVLIVNSRNLGKPEPTNDPAPFLSPAWRELNCHALREAKRLGIDVGVNLSGGWCMGGPWISPRQSGRWFLQSKLTVEGPRKLSEPLPLPGNRDGYDKVFNPPGFAEYVDLPLEKLDYRDTAVVAFRDEAEGRHRFAGKRAALLPAKTNRKDASNFTRAAAVMGPPSTPLRNEKADAPIAVEGIIDLTAKLRPDGTLDWDVPPGRWTIVRTGHRMTGSKLMIAPPSGDGLSVDWLASEPVDVQFENLGKVFLEDAAEAGTTLKYFCDDSFEDGFPNWTERIVERFREYRGYDPTPYFPVLAGFIVGSAEISDRFLYDYRRTVADCMADQHYGRLAALCHEHGLEAQNESAGPSRSGTMCMDGLMNLGRSDRPMGEFWLGLKHDEPGGEDPKLGYGVSRLEDGQNKVTKMVSSAAHTYGRRTASAEAFTSNRHWVDSPATLKHAADRAFCEGINRLIIHESTATRAAEGLPGYEYYAGTHFNANQTWWPYVGAFLEYLGRCQFLLRQGRFVADVLYYTGDGAPNVAVPKHVDPALGAGFDYDVCGTEVLLTRVNVRDGRIVLPDGMSYRLLVLPDDERMPVAVAAKLKELVAAGATIVGPKPVRTPGLALYPKCDDELRAIAEELWGDAEEKTGAAAAAQSATQRGPARTQMGRSTQPRRVGKGRVFQKVALREILTSDGVGPDFEHTGEAWLDFIHRETDEAGIYFVTNRNARAESAVDCAFRVSGRVPEIWDPVTGRLGDAAGWRAENGRTVVPMAFAAHQSFFVVFRRRPGEAARAEAEVVGASVKDEARKGSADANVRDESRKESVGSKVKDEPHQGVDNSNVNGGPRQGAARPEVSPYPLKPFQRAESVVSLAGGWTVHFDPAWGGPAEVAFERLEDWTKRSEEGIRHYSGTARYVKRFTLPASASGRRVLLDLGAVKEIAEVRLNGRVLGVVWTAPWSVDLTDALSHGENLVEVAVTNNWQNRLIGDAGLPANERRTRTNVEIKPDEPLRPSGLLGPVSLQVF